MSENDYIYSPGSVISSSNQKRRHIISPINNFVSVQEKNLSSAVEDYSRQESHFTSTISDKK